MVLAADYPFLDIVGTMLIFFVSHMAHLLRASGPHRPQLERNSRKKEEPDFG